VKEKHLIMRNHLFHFLEWYKGTILSDDEMEGIIDKYIDSLPVVKSEVQETTKTGEFVFQFNNEPPITMRDIYDHDIAIIRLPSSNSSNLLDTKNGMIIHSKEPLTFRARSIHGHEFKLYVKPLI